MLGCWLVADGLWWAWLKGKGFWLILSAWLVMKKTKGEAQGSRHLASVGLGMAGDEGGRLNASGGWLFLASVPSLAHFKCTLFHTFGAHEVRKRKPVFIA